MNSNIKLVVINYRPIYKQVFFKPRIPLVRIQIIGNIITQAHPDGAPTPCGRHCVQPRTKTNTKDSCTHTTPTLTKYTSSSIKPPRT